MATEMTSTAEHLRNALDGRWRDVKNRMRATMTEDLFRPHYTPNTVIARTKVAEQMRIMAAFGVAADIFRKEHGGTGDIGAAITMIEMLAMSDLSLMVKAGVQWGLFGGWLRSTERHHEAYVKQIISLELRSCGMTETGYGSDVQSLGPPRPMNPRPKSSSSVPEPDRRGTRFEKHQTANVVAVFSN
jgi:acyl-CoA oxidase